MRFILSSLGIWTIALEVFAAASSPTPTTPPTPQTIVAQYQSLRLNCAQAHGEERHTCYATLHKETHRYQTAKAELNKVKAKRAIHPSLIME